MQEAEVVDRSNKQNRVSCSVPDDDLFQPKHDQTVTVSQCRPCVYYGYHDNKGHVTVTTNVT